MQLNSLGFLFKFVNLSLMIWHVIVFAVWCCVSQYVMCNTWRRTLKSTSPSTNQFKKKKKNLCFVYKRVVLIRLAKEPAVDQGVSWFPPGSAHGPSWCSVCPCGLRVSSRCSWLCWWWLGPSRLSALSSAAAFFSSLLLLPACPLITFLLSWDQHAHTHRNKHTPAETLTFFFFFYHRAKLSVRWLRL